MTRRQALLATLATLLAPLRKLLPKRTQTVTSEWISVPGPYDQRPLKRKNEKRA